ncbi:MAG: DUF2953 domain-containing protein [Ruminococcus sp.]|nr:DUF2953 domain-containing protein [Candidatus Copronaster equi]
MTALYIILGIILFFALVLSVPVMLHLDYTDSTQCSVSWLFVKIKLYPREKKEKEKKEETPKKEEKKEEPEEKKEEKPKEKKENFLVTFYKNEGVSGVIELLGNCVSALKKMSKGFINSIFIRKFYLDIKVTESDAAATAIKYGKICSGLYPSLGFICSNMHVKNYKVNVLADYCGDKTKCDFSVKVGVVPLILINAGIAFVFRLLGQLLKVVFANIKSGTKKANNNMKGGNTK